MSLWEYMVFHVINIAINHSSLKCLMFGKWAKDSTLITLIRCLLRIMEKIETLLVVMVVSEFLTCMFLETGTKFHKPEKKWHRERGFWFGPRINGKSGEITSSNFKIFSKFLIKHPLDTLPLHFSLLSVSTWEVKRLLCRDYSENLRPGFAGSLLQGYQALVPAHASKYHVITYAWELQFCQHRGPWVDDVSFVLKNILAVLA